MELIQGANLSTMFMQFYKNEIEFPLRVVKIIKGQVLKALSYLHSEQRVVH